MAGQFRVGNRVEAGIRGKDGWDAGEISAISREGGYEVVVVAWDSFVVTPITTDLIRHESPIAPPPPVDVAQIRALRAEARLQGHEDIVDTCTKALGSLLRPLDRVAGDAWELCAFIIHEASARKAG